MTAFDAKTDLHRYLREGRQALLWKLEGLSEYDVRRPMTPTGTNLLGLVKHMAGVEAGYFGETFGRPFPEPMPWAGDESEANVDMWATAQESCQFILDLYRRVCAHADSVIDALDADSAGRVAHWGDVEVSLHRILVHVTSEIHRHAGHADIVRESIDGAAGLRDGGNNLASDDPHWWTRYRERLEATARQAGQV